MSDRLLRAATPINNHFSSKELIWKKKKKHREMKDEQEKCSLCGQLLTHLSHEKTSIWSAAVKSVLSSEKKTPVSSSSIEFTFRKERKKKNRHRLCTWDVWSICSGGASVTIIVRRFSSPFFSMATSGEVWRISVQCEIHGDTMKWGRACIESVIEYVLPSHHIVTTHNSLASARLI